MFFTALLIIFGASLGTAQIVSLNGVRDNSLIICGGEVVTYTCTALSQVLRVQWIVEPFVNANDNRRVIENVESQIGDVTMFDAAVIQYVSNNPFITTLTMNGTTANTSTTIVCSTVGQNPEVLLNLSYLADDDAVEPVSSLMVQDVAAGFNHGAIMVTFEKSSSMNVARYKVNCTVGNCEGVEIDATENSAVIMASSSCTGIPHTVSVTAVNRCGRESTIETKEIPLNFEDAVKPVSSLMVQDVAAGFRRGAIMVTFEKSSSMNVARYKVNCTVGNCEGVVIDATENSAVIMASSSCTGEMHTVSVTAVDRCGRESMIRTKEIRLKAKELCGFMIAFFVVTGILVAVIAVFTISFVCACKKKESFCKCCDECCRNCCLICCHKGCFCFQNGDTAEFRHGAVNKAVNEHDNTSSAIV